MIARFVTLATAALCLASAAGGGAVAQTPVPTSTPVSVPTLPPNKTLDPYARAAVDILTNVVNRQIQNAQNSANGQVSYFHRFDMQVQTGRNSYRTIHLHQGTIINPTGKSIQVGQQVSVGGPAQADGSLNADVITIQQ